MTIAWTERLSIDRGIIDQDHRVLIDLCNAFINGNCEADRKGLAEILSDLEHYARSHFWREGELQRKIRFCYAGQQSEEHLALVKTLGDIAMEFFRAKEGSDFYRVTQEIRALLRSWLIDHILKSDIHMAA